MSAPETLPAFLADRAERFRDREAVIGEQSRWTYGELAAEATRVATGLEALGVGPGDRVGILLPNWPEFFAAAFGVTALGAVAVCLNTMATETELAFYLDHAAVRWLVYTPRFLKHDYEARLAGFGVDGAAAERRAARDLELRIAVRASTSASAAAGARDGGTGSASELGLQTASGATGATSARVVGFASLGRAVADPIAWLRTRRGVSPDATAVIFFTSGSTAQPKAVLHAHRALVHQAFTASEAFGLAPEDRSWGCLPMFFAGGFVIIGLITFATGGALVLQDHFEAERALELMERERITFYAGWQLAPALVDHPTFAARKLSLRKGIYTVSPAAARLLAPDHVAVGAYGLSETATVVCLARWDDPFDLRTRGFGRPLPGVEFRVVDPESRAPLPEGSVGEIEIRGPSLMQGYLGAPREEAFTADGFFRTGDYGRLDETRTLRFEGRLKEVIKTAGVNVAAAEVEECLVAAEGVAAAYVVPVPHPVRGENIAAFVVAKAGCTLDPEGLLEHCRRLLASYKVPRHLFELAASDVPRTGTQKVDKPRLRREAAGLAGTSADLAVG